MSDHDMTYVQPPTMTQRHVDAIWQCYRLFCFPGFADQQTLLEIWQHLTALLAQPVPSREHVLTPLERITHASNYTPPSFPELHSPADWRDQYKPPTVADCFECDQ